MKFGKKMLTAAALGLGMSLSSAMNANADIFSDFVFPNLGPTGTAEIRFNFNGFGNGSVYASEALGGPVGTTTGAGTLDGEVAIPIIDGATTTSGFGEDSWGIGQVTSIEVRPEGSAVFSVVWAPIVTGSEITFMFYNSIDIQLDNAATGTDEQRILGADMRFDLWEDDSPDYTGGGTRNGLADFDGVAGGIGDAGSTLILSALADAGHFAFESDGSTADNSAASNETFFAPATSTGRGEAFFEVGTTSGGTGVHNGAFDTDMVDNGLRSALDETADIRIEFSSEAGTAPGAFIIEIESGSATAYAVPTPAAAWIGLAGFGAMGLLRRNRKA